MKGSMSVSKISFKNGTDLELKENSIVLFVGANNSGKSLTLRELYALIKDNRSIGKTKYIIDSVDVQKNGTSDEALTFLNSRIVASGQYALPSKAGTAGSSLSEDQIVKSWTSLQNDTTVVTSYVHSIANFFVAKLDTQDRLLLVMPSENIAFGQKAVTPIQVLKKDVDKELEFSKLFRKAFKQDIIVNHDGGPQIPLHVGSRPESTKEQDRVSFEYSEKLNKLGQLQNQGDGMKSFAGVFLSLFAEDFSMNIIDEPEAFLHPPQAKLLGEMLAKNLDSGKQLFISTHSEHFLKGLLAFGGDRLIVVRLLTEHNNTKTTILDNADLKKIWKEPILKHSSILDGLFHAKVVLSESEGDSRFFSAVASTVIEENDFSSPDIHYVQCGGKHQFPTAINALKKLNVPLTVIADFDILNADSPLKSAYEGLGGTWDDINADFKIVKADIDAQRPELSTEDLKRDIEEILDKIQTTVVSNDNIKELEKTIKKASAWGVAKRAGKSLVSPGDATKAYNRLDAKLKKAGLIVLEVGEIESFDKTVGNHGPRWVNEVLEKDLGGSEDLKIAREFVKEYILHS